MRQLPVGPAPRVDAAVDMAGAGDAGVLGGLHGHG